MTDAYIERPSAQPHQALQTNLGTPQSVHCCWFTTTSSASPDALPGLHRDALWFGSKGPLGSLMQLLAKCPKVSQNTQLASLAPRNTKSRARSKALSVSGASENIVCLATTLAHLPATVPVLPTVPFDPNRNASRRGSGRAMGDAGQTSPHRAACAAAPAGGAPAGRC